MSRPVVEYSDHFPTTHITQSLALILCLCVHMYEIIDMVDTVDTAELVDMVEMLDTVNTLDIVNMVDMV